MSCLIQRTLCFGPKSDRDSSHPSTPTEPHVPFGFLCARFLLSILSSICRNNRRRSPKTILLYPRILNSSLRTNRPHPPRRPHVRPEHDGRNRLFAFFSSRLDNRILAENVFELDGCGEWDGVSGVVVLAVGVEVVQSGEFAEGWGAGWRVNRVEVGYGEHQGGLRKTDSGLFRSRLSSDTHAASPAPERAE